MWKCEAFDVVNAECGMQNAHRAIHHSAFIIQHS